MRSRVSFKEIIAMFFVIISFAATGIFIINENYRYALGGLTCVACFVLIAFLVVMADDSDSILDLTNPSLRNPRKAGSGKVQYISRITPDMKFGKSDGKDSGRFSDKSSDKSSAKFGGKSSAKSSGKSNTKFTGKFTEKPMDSNYESNLEDDFEGSFDEDGFYESVGNMKVYKRGEKIEYHDTNE